MDKGRFASVGTGCVTIRLIRALHFDVRLHLAAFVRLLTLVHICTRAFARHLHPAQSQHASHQQQGQQFFHYPFHVFQVDFQLYNKKIATFSRYKVTIFFFIIQIFFLHHPPETLTLSGYKRLMSLHQQLLGHRASRGFIVSSWLACKYGTRKQHLSP